MRSLNPLLLLLLRSLALADRRDVERAIEADPAIHNLKFCGSCKITWLPEHNPCSGESTVVSSSGCKTMACLCDVNYRATRTNWILNGVEKYCGAKDTITPQATVQWFEGFCDAQLAALPPPSVVPPPGGTSTRAAAATPARGDNSQTGVGPMCIGDNCTINNDHINDVPVAPAPAPQTPTTSNAAVDNKLTLGISLGLGVPTFLVGVLALCAYA